MEGGLKVRAAAVWLGSGGAYLDLEVFWKREDLSSGGGRLLVDGLSCNDEGEAGVRETAAVETPVSAVVEGA